jgi:hypothetical protein
MFYTLMTKIASVIAAPLVAVLSLAGYSLSPQQTDYSAYIQTEIARYVETSKQNLGADSTLPVAGVTYNLSGAGISSSATSFTLSSFTLPQNGYALTDADVAPNSATAYFTLEPGNRSRQEIVGCTTVVQNVSGTATISGCTRGLSPISPYTASSSLQFAHAGSAQVILSNPPQQQNLYAAKDNDESITGIWTVASTSPPRYAAVPAAHQTGTHASTTAEFASVALVNAVTTAGAPDASETAQGLVELATQGEAASSTSSGTEARLVLGGNIATDTPNTATRSGRVLMSDLTGFLKQAWLDLSATFTWTGAHTWSGAQNFLFSNAGAKVGVGTSTPLKAFEVASDAVVGNNVLASSFTATSTTATSTINDLRVVRNATTTTLFVSGDCIGCASRYTASSTAFSVSTGATTFAGSIPPFANLGLVEYRFVEGTYILRENFLIMRSGLTAVTREFDDVSGTADDNDYLFTWSTNDFIVSETGDENSDSSIEGTVYWLK